MKVIDRKSGKRVGAEQKVINKELAEKDPIDRFVEKNLEESEYSPMDPPDAYDLDSAASANLKTDLSDTLKKYIEEHNEVKEKANVFEAALNEFKESGYIFTQGINDRFNEFFVYFDNEILPHNRMEEKKLFPLLSKRLLESGEHGVGEDPQTAVDMMEDDHVKFIQLASLTFNLLGLAARLPDMNSRALTYDIAFHNGKELIELLRLHIFREDNTLFPLTQELLTTEELKQVYDH